jgi:phage antirepressor YoqD-like protein
MDTKKIDLATKLDKLMAKILNKNQVQIFNDKTRNTIFNKNDDSGLFSLNESDIFRGNEMGK